MSDSVRAAAVATPAAQEYAELRGLVKGAGLLRRRYRFYAVTMSVNLLAFVGGWVAFVFIGDSWWQLPLAAFLAVVFAQLSFIGHDAGHRQILRGRTANDVVGIVHAGLVGLSYSTWVDQHNRHHAHPNDAHRDPDVDIAVLAFTREQAREKRGPLRWVAAHQAVLFFPLLLLEAFSLHVSSVSRLRAMGVRTHRVEALLLAAHFAVYLTAVFLVLSPLVGVAFILVHQCLWGLYMGCSFAPGHKGMPVLEEGENPGFLRRQVVTTRNIRGGRGVSWVLGGLNYQIEHHLFPSMARPDLRLVQPIVRDFCARHAIDYAESGWLRTYGHVLAHLHETSAPLRAAPQPA
ncbi:fatty acid desaturase family protein [Pseudonocardia pini]|uniref:fatty acid desaturase family protein n=1 Tax=Pseudonocardia pini TaxID=2758030 RepID=UPI0015F0DE8C|nr:acyl-CoA desaturase [Pseudonocardia pini]